MKGFTKKIGKFFIALGEIQEVKLRQSVLLVDGNFIPPNTFALIIRHVKDKFANANLVVLTFKDKKEFIKNNFPDAETVVTDGGCLLKRYALALRLFFLLRKKFRFIVLSSLDVSVVSIALMFAKCPVLLHNRWFEWYRLRQRTVADVLFGVRSADKRRRKTNRGLRGMVKSCGRAFVLLSEINEEDIKAPVLVVDNGYTDIAHVSTAVRRAIAVFLNPNITVLTFAPRRHFYVHMFPESQVIVVEQPSYKYALALEMYRLRKRNFVRCVLTTLDVTPILISMLFMKTEVFLYNRWHQWWTLQQRNAGGYLKGLFVFFASIPTFVYLLIAGFTILLKTGIRFLIHMFTMHYELEA